MDFDTWQRGVFKVAVILVALIWMLMLAAVASPTQDVHLGKFKFQPGVTAAGFCRAQTAAGECYLPQSIPDHLNAMPVAANPWFVVLATRQDQLVFPVTAFLKQLTWPCNDPAHWRNTNARFGFCDSIERDDGYADPQKVDDMEAGVREVNKTIRHRGFPVPGTFGLLTIGRERFEERVMMNVRLRTSDHTSMVAPVPLHLAMNLCGSDKQYSVEATYEWPRFNSFPVGGIDIGYVGDAHLVQCIKDGRSVVGLWK